MSDEASTAGSAVTPRDAAIESPQLTDQQRLIEYLRHRDEPCPLCQYNLRDLTHDTCPECGQALRLRVGLVEPFYKAWIMLAAALCAGGGVGLCFIFESIIEGPSFPTVILSYLSVWSFICQTPCAVLMLIFRRRFLRLERRRQWLLAWPGVMWVLLAFVLLVIQMVTR